MSFFRKAIDGMRAYTPGLQPRETRYVKLNTNENPYPPSPKVLAAVARETERLRLYPDPMSTEFRQAAASLNGFEIDWVIAGNGSDDVLTMLCRAAVGPGDKVFFPYPTYSLYEVLVDIQEGVNCPVDYPGDWSLPDGLFGNPGVLTFVANPNSPSGTVVPTEDLARLAKSLKGLLIIDEAYVDFADADCAQLVEELPNVVVLRTLSKSYSLAGMRLGYALAQPPVIAGLMKVKDSYNLDRLAIAAGKAALEDVEAMRQNVVKVRATRQHLVTALETLGMTVAPSAANFVWTTPPSPHSAEELYRRLWEEDRILVRHFQARMLRDGLRITVGTDQEIDMLLSALKRILSGSHPHGARGHTSPKE